MTDARDTQRWPLKKVVVSWSGGVDSTAVLACLIDAGYECLAVSNTLYDKRTPRYAERERMARSLLRPALIQKAVNNGVRVQFDEIDGECIWEFALRDEAGNVTMAIPQRNKRILDLLMARYVMPRGWMNIAMGEYVGVDTWVVRDHVPPNDCDHRALSAYLYSEYGIGYRFVSLADFGESRYKSDRVALGAKHIDMSLTTNCMADSALDCGACYKCVERAAAFDVAKLEDRTRYVRDPRMNLSYPVYVQQMHGYRVSAPYANFPQHQ